MTDRTSDITGGAQGPVAVPWLNRPVPARLLLALLAGWLAFDQLLLWQFLGWGGIGALLLGGGITVILMIGVARLATDRLPDPSRGILLGCILIGLVLMMLGGQGRFFYANIDWQVRLAVLNDMATHPWPFVYTARTTPDLLRAPIAMFLMPALAAKAAGAGDIALLIQNGVLAGLLLALGSTLFAAARERRTALIVFLLFSGMDAIGDLILHGGLSDHLDDWADIQYSSTLTLAFWVPQHAIAGWIGALGYMLWREGGVRPGAFLALLPLTALWSPLAFLGAMPFAALAGVRAIVARQVRGPDIALPALASLLCVPGFLYLGAANGEVGIRPVALPAIQWLLFQGLETLPFLIPLLLAGRAVRFGRDTLLLIALWLFAIPFVQIGWSVDFMMRASIPALAMLPVMVAHHLATGGGARVWLLVVLAIGNLTGLSEVRRAFANDPAPQVRCSFFKAWDQNFAGYPKGSYLAPLPQVPELIRPANPARASAREPTRCWEGSWYRPRQLSRAQNGVER